MENSWKLYFISEETWEAQLAYLAKAEKSIDYEQFSFEDVGDGEIGRRFIDIFVSKAKQGLSVRVLLDGVGSWHIIGPSIQNELTEAGVKFVVHTIATYKLTKFFRMLFRDHRKLCIIDDKTAFIGGVIVGEKAREWRDTAMLIEGPAVHALKKFFEDAWQGLGHDSRPIVSAPQDAGPGFQVIGSGPHPSQRYVLKELVRQIDRASKFVKITSPYWNPPRALTWSIRRARKRGVKIELIIPRQSDNIMADFVSYSFYGKFLRMGVDIYMYPTYVHAKSVTIDGNWGFMGSTNMDRLSLFHNYELNVTSTNLKFITDLDEQSEKDIARSEKVIYKLYKKRSLSVKILSLLAIFLRPII